MKKLRGINLAILILSGMLILAFGFGYSQIANGKIAKNTYIKEVNVGNLTKEEAKLKIQNECEINTIIFTYKDKTWNVKPDDIDTDYDIDETINNAFKVNRNKGVFSNIINSLKSNFGVRNNINIVVDCNEEKAKNQLEKIAKDIDINMENARLDLSSGKIYVIGDKAGLKVDVDTTLKNLKKTLQEGIFQQKLVVTKVEPEVTKEDLKNINTLLGSYKTVLSDVSPGRVENIKIATERTSGVLLMPGESFSYNDHTGLRTIKNGYKNATVIVSGEPAQGVGGGVCQVSTTLYNAVLYAGLDIVKVSNHSIPSNYVDKGRDAVVSDSGLDFVFKNNYDRPVYIQNYYSNGVVTCQIYGDIKDNKHIDISTSIDKVNPAPIKKENDPTLKKGEEKVLENGRDAYTVSTYRIYYDNNGKEIKREKIAISYYPSKQAVIAVGTKKEVSNTNKEESNSNKDENNSSSNENNSNNNSNGNNNDDSNANNNNDNLNDNEINNEEEISLEIE